MYIHVYIYIYVYTYVYIYACIHVDLCVHVDLYVHNIYETIYVNVIYVCITYDTSCLAKTTGFMNSLLLCL